MHISSLLAALGLLLLTEHAGHADADAGQLRAKLACERALGPGRVICELTTEAASGKLVWSDALVVRAPAFARPLRSRFVAQLGGTVGPTSAWAKLALVASGAGQGQLELLARGVICDERAGAEACRALTRPVTALVEVGASAAAP